METLTARQTKVSAKGWVVIPAALRRRYGLTPGTVVHVHDRDGEIVISIGQPAYKEARGMLPAEPSLTEELLAERAGDLEREEAKIRSLLCGRVCPCPCARAGSVAGHRRSRVQAGRVTRRHCLAGSRCGNRTGGKTRDSKWRR